MSLRLPTSARVAAIVVLILQLPLLAKSVDAADLWVAPTSQQDLGGPQVGSNIIWPVTPWGAVRMVWAVPGDFETFQSAKLVLISDAPAGAATVFAWACHAMNLTPAANCVGPIGQPYVGVADQLVEVDVSALVGPQMTGPGVNHIALVAITTPTTATDHVVGLRITYTPSIVDGTIVNADINASAGIAPSKIAGTAATLGANTFSGTQTAPAFVGSGAGLTNLPAVTSSEIADGTIVNADISASAAIAPGKILGTAATLGANSFTATQTISAGNLDLAGSTSTTGNLTKGGLPFLHNFGASNTFVGGNAGNFTLTGGGNTGVGLFALVGLASGSANTAVGTGALFANTSGFGNTAIGANANDFNATGTDNTAIGWNALGSNTGSSNVAIGSGAGAFASTGTDNIYIGMGTVGAAGESGHIYIGRQGFHTQTLIDGIRGVTTGVADAVPVMIDSNGQLGTISSSRRFKTDIQGMGTASSALFALRPVTFRYKRPYADGKSPMQYGLVAEEVAESFPDLAVRSADGEVETVHYETLSVLLLNEVQRLRREVDSLHQKLHELERSR